MTESREWSTFLRIPPEGTSDHVPLDPGWCAARGVNTGAATVLRLLRDYVAPLVDRLEREQGLESYHFACHDRTSGVPAPEGDNGDFIHLRLFFRAPVAVLTLASMFEMTRPTEPDMGLPSGVDPSLISAADARRLIDGQAAWVLSLVRAHKWTDDAEMVRQVLQFGHFFANMLQMRLG